MFIIFFLPYSRSKSLCTHRGQKKEKKHKNTPNQHVQPARKQRTLCMVWWRASVWKCERPSKIVCKTLLYVPHPQFDVPSPSLTGQQQPNTFDAVPRRLCLFVCQPLRAHYKRVTLKNTSTGIHILMYIYTYNLYSMCTLHMPACSAASQCSPPAAVHVVGANRCAALHCIHCAAQKESPRPHKHAHTHTHTLANCVYAYLFACSCSPGWLAAAAAASTSSKAQLSSASQPYSPSPSVVRRCW